MKKEMTPEEKARDVVREFMFCTTNDDWMLRGCYSQAEFISAIASALREERERAIEMFLEHDYDEAIRRLRDK